MSRKSCFLEIAQLSENTENREISEANFSKWRNNLKYLY